MRAFSYLTKQMKRFAELEAEWDKLKAEREAIARKRSKAEERGKIDLRLAEINRERVAVNKLIRKQVVKGAFLNTGDLLSKPYFYIW